MTIRSSIIFHQDDSEWEISDCTRPDFLTSLSSRDFRLKRDPAMERIEHFPQVSHLKELFKKRLSEAYIAGGFDRLVSTYKSFKQEYAETGINMGLLLSDFTWWLAPNKKEKSDYTRFLDLFTHECPDWTESWFAMAWHVQLAGNSDRAVGYYEKSLELFPGNVLARRNLALIRFLLKSDNE